MSFDFDFDVFVLGDKVYGSKLQPAEMSAVGAARKLALLDAVVKRFALCFRFLICALLLSKKKIIEIVDVVLKSAELLLVKKNSGIFIYDFRF